MEIRVFTRALLIAALSVATGCSGGGGGGGIDGGGGGGTVTNPGGGIDRSGNSVGTIDGFGSVIVNGVEWETDGSTVFTVEDDDSSSQDDLDVGDVVIIRGTIDDSTGAAAATSVEADDLIEGPISTINASAATFVVLGQTVRTDLDTAYITEGIQPGDQVVISQLDAVTDGMTVRSVETTTTPIENNATVSDSPDSGPDLQSQISDARTLIESTDIREKIAFFSPSAPLPLSPSHLDSGSAGLGSDA